LASRVSSSTSLDRKTLWLRVVVCAGLSLALECPPDPQIRTAVVSEVSIAFGIVTISQTVDRSISISNAPGSSGSLDGSTGVSGSGFSIVSGGGSFSLPPGQSHTVTVRFVPTQATSYSGTLSITHNGTNTGTPIPVPLSGTGGSISIAINPGSVSYGTITVGQIRDTTITISNPPGSSGPLNGSTSVSGPGFSIVSGAESFSLQPGQSRNVIVRFAPTQATSYSGTLSITHNGSNAGTPIPVPLSGTGSISIIITVTPSSVDFGTVTVGQTRDTTITISNAPGSSGPLNGSTSVSGAGFSIISGGGSFSLLPGQSHTVTVRFAPTQATSYSGTLSITHNATNTGTPITVPLSGAGGSIIITVTPSSVDFGTVTVGQTRDTTITISNAPGSSGPLNGSTSGAGFSISGGGSFSLPPGQSHTVTVRFAPTVTASYSGTLSITHNATNTGSPILVPLSGTGANTVTIMVTPSSLTFGTVTVGEIRDTTITISNATGSSGPLEGSTSVSGSGFSIVTGGGSFSLQPGQSRTVIVRFAPTQVIPYSGALSITHNATNTGSPIPVPLSGTGVNAITITVTPSSVAFGTVTVGQIRDTTITISNVTGSSGPLDGSTSVSGSGFSIVSGGGAFSLSPGQSQIVSVRFAPSNAVPYSGGVTITHNGTNANNPITVPLSGTGTNAITVTVTPSSIAFGAVTVGQTLDRDITISNASGSTGTLAGSSSVGGSGFSIVTGGGDFSLAPNQSRIVTIRFAPSSTIPYSGTVTITHNATNTATPISVPLTGTGVNDPCADRRPIALGQSLNGTLTTASCEVGSRYEERWTLTLATRAKVQIDLTSGTFDTYLYVADANGSPIEEDDDDGDGTNARVIRVLAAGTYLIRATSFSPGVTGSYQLAVRIRIAQITVQFDSIRVFNSGDISGTFAGELYGTFLLTRSSGSDILLFSRNRDFPLSISTDQAYSGLPTFGSFSFTLPEVGGSWFDIRWEFLEADPPPFVDERLGGYYHQQNFDLDALGGGWSGVGTNDLQGAQSIPFNVCHGVLVAPTISRCTERRRGSSGETDIRFYWTVRVD